MADRKLPAMVKLRLSRMGRSVLNLVQPSRAGQIDSGLRQLPEKREPADTHGIARSAPQSHDASSDGASLVSGVRAVLSR